MTISEAITGNEKVYNSEEHKALSDFYMAFNTKNAELMGNNWANTNEIAMDNPLGGIKRGWDELKSVYDRIFAGELQVYVEFYDYSVITTGDMFCAIGRERGHARRGERETELSIRTSRIYKKIDGSWRQVHHHGSIDDPALLREYQNIVLNK